MAPVVAVGAVARLQASEATALAEGGKFWQCVVTFDEALEIVGAHQNVAGLREQNEVREMKAQALMQV